MGFSVSGSFAVLVVAAFMAFGMAYSAGADGFEDVRESTKDVGESQLATQNTAITVSRAEMVTEVITNYLSIEVENNGTTTLSVNETDILIDNQYVTSDEIANDSDSNVSVEGDEETDLWQPGETLQIELSSNLLDDLLADGTPDRVKVATEHGVSDSRGVA